MSDLITDFPALLNYWDFDKNIKIDVEKITITSKKHINWKCPTCSYEWKASTSKSYKNIQNHSKICPVCELGKVFIKGENLIIYLFLQRGYFTSNVLPVMLVGKM